MRQLVNATIAAITLASCASASDLANLEIGENDIYLHGNITKLISRKRSPAHQHCQCAPLRTLTQKSFSRPTIIPLSTSPGRLARMANRSK